MKAIELTKEQKIKLLEMCKALFPEYDFTLDKWRFCFVTLGLKKKKLYEEHIHWFEFCFTHLSQKLGTQYGEAFYMMIYNRHPIDYLYSEFKKIKL